MLFFKGKWAIGETNVTIIAALVALLCVVGIIGAVVKRLFRVAVMFAVFALLIVGAAVYVIATMH